MNSVAKGNRAELDAWEELEDEGWLVGTRRKGRREKGPGDHLAWKPDERPMLVEVKESKRGPWQDFPPVERAQIRDFAKRRGIVPMLMWRSAPSKPFQWIDETAWPDAELTVAA